MIMREHGPTRSQMSSAPDSTTADLQQTVADLRRRLSESRCRLGERTAERDEAQAREAAIAEVLGFINSSPGHLEPVFDAMVERAARLCEADEAALRTFDGSLLHLVATHGEPGVFEELMRLGPSHPDGLYEAIALGEPLTHIIDVCETEAFRTNVRARERLELRRIRSWLAVALRRDGALLGVINVHRHTVRPFTDKQIALLQNFAAQAVIAIENARLLTETQEALEQQTATAEVLQVINSSPGELAPVFDAMLDKATRVCAAEAGVLCTYDGERFWPVAHRGFGEFPRDPIRSHPETGTGRLARGEDIVHILDSAIGAPLEARDPGRLALVRLGGARTQLAAALRKEGRLLGSFTIWRREVRPFSEKQIALLQNFAAQAVIAMENARLITETREALEQQTATAEVLQVINSSPGDLAPVFDAMLEKALKLCDAAFGVLWTGDGESYRAAALRGVPPVYAEFVTREPRGRRPGGPLGRLARGEPLVHIPDTSASTPDETGRTLDGLGGIRTLLAVPLRKDGAMLGAFTLYRQEVRPFSEKQIALLQNF